MLKRISQNLVVVLMVLLLQTGMALAEKSVPKTGDPAWDTLSQVKKDWMLKLYDIVVVDRPELKPIADESLEWRLKEMEYDTKKFQYMSDKHPDMIVRDKGLYAFANLDWFPEFSEELSRKDPAFAELEKKIKTLKEELSKSKNLKTLEEFINNLNKNEKHKEKFKKFTEELARVQKILTSGAAKVTHKNQ
jgi:molybdopterin converting factor small subunit